MARLLGNERQVANGLVRPPNLENVCLFVKQWRGSIDEDKMGNHERSKSGMRATMLGPELSLG